MARLGQIIKTLNIGIATAADFLNKKGQPVEQNPNLKLTETQEALLMKEFKSDKSIKQESERLIQQRYEKDRGQSVAADVYKTSAGKVVAEKKKQDAVVVEEEKSVIEEEMPTQSAAPVAEVVEVEQKSAPVEEAVPVQSKPEPEPEPEPEPAPKLEPTPEITPEVVVTAPVTVIEEQPVVVESEKKPTEPVTVETAPAVSETIQTQNADVSAAEDPKPEPIAEQKIEPEPIETPTPQPQLADDTPEVSNVPEAKKEDDIFVFRKTGLESSIKVVDKIDLSAINNTMRPAKKTKEQKRRERIAKERQQRSGVSTTDKNVAVKKPQQQTANRQPVEGKAKPEIFTTPASKLKTPKQVVKTDSGNAPAAASGHGDRKKKRKRISNERVNINSYSSPPPFDGSSKGKKGRNRLTSYVPVSDEDVAKQVKETLARLTESKRVNKKGARYRKDKRDAVEQRMQAQAARERHESSVLKLTEFVTANELAAMMDIPVTEVIKTCLNLGLFVSINQRLDAETINIVADEFGFKTEFVGADAIHAIISDEEDREEDLVSRPPIVTVMGHVDHGKTSLLDYIRKSNVIAGEAGGITQHIGAYNVALEDGRHITFLDTPGHEAFTAMRARGAQVTDIAIIIIAADDGVMPQTIEAINHAAAAGVPIVFAINKIDKNGANPDKIKETLSAMNYLVEEWGGKYQSQDISAKQGIGVNELLEKVLLEAEMLDLKANPKRKAVGSVIESSLDKGRGYVATLLVETGTLHLGDVVLAGTAYGRIKAMFNERNQRIKEAAPAEPVIILGLNGAPQAGDIFNVFAAEHEAREIANTREQLQREQGLRTSRHLTLEEIGRRIALGNFQEFNLIVKGDVDGSIEALSDSLIKLSTEEIQVNVIHKAVGQISESDIMLAVASNAIVVGFQVRPSPAARKMAEHEQIDIRLYSIIYDAIAEIKSAMEGLLSPDIKEEVTAVLEVRDVFKISKIGTVAGCSVREGKIKRGSKVRLIRDGIVVYTGELASLKREKEDVKEVASGYECGLNIGNYNDIKVGDLIESYEETEVKKKL
ncbi:MAG: translation initiation factor IF-2 [Prevotellaceae bacterium]|jgi:translation initiation factor IF-2|nr:translation initiation factor IF-2 [Prevotellaceae bacterium]